MARLFSSLRIRLLALVLLAIIPCFALILYSAWEIREDAAGDAKEEALRLARNVAREQRNFIRKTRALLGELAQSPAVEQNPKSCSALFAERLKQYPEYSLFGVAGLDGDIWCSALPFEGRVNISDRDYFQKTIATRDFSGGGYQILAMMREGTEPFASCQSSLVNFPSPLFVLWLSGVHGTFLFGTNRRRPPLYGSGLAGGGQGG